MADLKVFLQKKNVFARRSAILAFLGLRVLYKKDSATTVEMVILSLAVSNYDY